MLIKTVEVETLECDKWIAVGDFVLDFTLKDYDRYNFNDLYIVDSSGNEDGVFCIFQLRRNGVRDWSRLTLLDISMTMENFSTFIHLCAPFINLKTDEKIKVNGEVKQKVFIFFPSKTPMEMAVMCLYLKHHDHRYGITDYVPF